MPPPFQTSRRPEASDPSASGPLLIVAGASCSGKTTFLRTLERSAATVLPAELRHLDLARLSWRDAMDLPAGPARPETAAGAAAAGGMVLHYDLFRPVTFHGADRVDARSFAADPALARIRARIQAKAGDCAILTLWEDPALLAARAEARRRRLWQKLLRPPVLRGLPANAAAYRAARIRRGRMRAWFADPDRLWSLYEGWFDFTEACGIARHWVARPLSAPSAGPSSGPVGAPDYRPLAEIRAQGPLWPLRDRG